jgi:glycosyltransferase involved in cell wall biosynthesis
VLFQHNVEAMIWKRHYETQINLLKKAYLYGQWRKGARYEGAACRSVDAVIAVSTNDAEQMRSDYGAKNVADVPTGVDTEYFSSGDVAQRDSARLVFTGSMDWLPNDDGMRFFIESIYPRIKQKIPNVSLTIVGRNPLPSLFAFSERDASIRITGRVEDVRPFMDEAAVYIVPLRIGGGTRLKIFEAMAMAKPIVSTTIGAEGLPVRDEAELLLADTPEEFSAAVVRLLEDEALAKRLGANGCRLVREKYSWTWAAKIFANICEQARERDKAAPAIIENETEAAISPNELEMSGGAGDALKG